MKKTYLPQLIILILVSFLSGSLHSQCTLAITPGDTTICVGDSVTLTANTSAPASLATIMVSNNGGSAGGINFFDLTVAANNISITSLDINLGVLGGAVTVDMYVRVGTYVGFTGSTAGWTLAGTATGPISNGTDVPTPVTFASPVGLNASTTYGVAFIIDAAHSWRYTNGTGPNQAYSNADLSLALGSAGNVPWTTVFTPRVWNGTIYYDIPSTVLWSTGQTTPTITVGPSTNTTYIVTSSCALSDTVNITVSNFPVVALGNDTTFCSPGTLMLNAGNPGATYLWNTSATTQTISAGATGVYSVQVMNAAGCVDADTMNLVVNPLPVVALGNDTTICSADSITLNAGNAGASYLWSSGDITQMETFTSAFAGLIYVDVVDANSCASSDSINVTFQTPAVALGADTAICEGASITLDAGTAGVTYLWSDNTTTQMNTVSAVGTYYVDVMSAIGCPGTDTINVSFTVVDTSVAVTTYILTSNAVGASYQWIYCDSVAIVGETGQSFAPTNDGNYAVIVTVNGCPDTSACVNMILLGTNSHNLQNVNISPNPTAGELMINLGRVNETVTVSILDMGGRLISAKQFTATSTIQLQIEGDAGVYLIGIQSAEGATEYFKVIKQ